MAEYKFGSTFLEEEKEDKPVATGEYQFGQTLPEEPPEKKQEYGKVVETLASLDDFPQSFGQSLGQYVAKFSYEADQKHPDAFFEGWEYFWKIITNAPVASMYQEAMANFKLAGAEEEAKKMRGQSVGGQDLAIALKNKERYANDSEYRKEVDDKLETVRKEIFKEVDLIKKQREQKLNDANLGEFGKSLSQSAASMATVGAGMVATAATRGKAAPYVAPVILSSFGLQTAGIEYGEGRRQGLSHEDALKYGGIAGIAEAGTEAIPLMKFLSAPARGTLSKILKDGAEATLLEVGQENVTTLIQEFNKVGFDLQSDLNTAVRNMNNPLYDGPNVIDVIADNAAHTSFSALLLGGSLATARAGGGVLYSDGMKNHIRENADDPRTNLFIKELEILANNASLQYDAIDRFAITALNPDFAGTDVSDVLAQEIINTKLITPSEIQVVQEEKKTPVQEVEEKFPSEKRYQFGENRPKVGGEKTIELDKSVGEEFQQVINDRMNEVSNLPETAPIKIETKNEELIDKIKNNIILPKKFPTKKLMLREDDYFKNLYYNYRDFDQQEIQKTSEVVSHFLEAGMPVDVFKELDFMGGYVHDDRYSKAYLTANLGAYVPSIKGLTLSAASGIKDNAFDIPAFSGRGREVLAHDTFIHEMAHHIDFTLAKTDLKAERQNLLPASIKSPLFNIPEFSRKGEYFTFKKGTGGAVMEEMLGIYQDARDAEFLQLSSGMFIDDISQIGTSSRYYEGMLFDYPFKELISYGDKSKAVQDHIKAETFAQAHLLYYTNRELMEAKAPETFKFFEQINDAISTESDRKKNEGLLRVFQSSNPVRSAEVSGQEGTDQTDRRGDREQQAGQRMDEQEGQPDRNDLGPEISKIVGAPSGVDNQRKVGALRRKIKKLVAAGEKNRFWYEESSKAILDVTNNDINDADKLAQVIAITSPQTNVDTNFTFALQAYYQWKAGKKIETGIFPKQMAPRIIAALEGDGWEGRKTNEFYNNLMRVIDPSRAQGVTVDMWMMRMFDFGKNTSTDRQYDFVAEQIEKIADELGWEPQQVQAAAWVAEKARAEGTEVSEAGFNFADAIQKNLAQISTETIPGRTNNHMNEMFDAPYEQVQEYHVSAVNAILDEDGSDIIAKKLGLLSPGLFEAPGYFEGRLSPGTQTQAVVPKARKTKDQVIQPEAEDLIKAYSAAYGILFKQDAVGYHKPFYQTNIPKSKRNINEVRIGRQITNEEIKQLADAMERVSGKNYLNPIPTPSGVRFINFAEQDGVKNIQFAKFVDQVLNEVQLADNIEVIEAGGSLGYITNDWTKSKNGEDYTQTSLSGRPDLQERVRSIVRELQPKVDEVDLSFSEKYGWTRDDSINAEFRRPAEIRRELNPDLELSTKEPSPPGRPPSENYEWTSGDELNANLGLQTFLTKLQNKYERQVVIEEVIEDQVGLGALKDLDLSVVDRLDLVKSIVGDKMLRVSDETETMLDKMIEITGGDYKSINEFLQNLHAPERNAFIYEERLNKLLQANEEYGPSENHTPSQKAQITRLANATEPFKNNGSGINTKEAIAKLREYGVEYNQKTNTAKAINEQGEKYLKVSKLAQDYIKATRKVYSDAGLVAEENLDDWNQRYKYYVPLSGFAADTTIDQRPNPKGGGASVYGMEVKKADGRTSMAGDPIIQMYKQRENAVVREQKNEVVKTLAKQAETFINPEVYTSLDTVPQGITMANAGWDPLRGTAYVFYKDDGQQKAVEIRDERLARAFGTIDFNGLNGILGTIAVATRFMSIMNTGYNVDFIFPNFSRDIYAATAGALGEQSKKGGRVYGSNIALAAAKNVFPRLGTLYKYYRSGVDSINDPEMKKMVEAYHQMGSKTSYFEFLDTETLTKNFTALEKYRQGSITAKELKKNTLDLVGDINNMIENGIRFSQFTEFVRQNGGIDNVSQDNLRRAAVQAKNASVNFDRRGEWGMEIGSLLMFFNPAVQGTVQFMRGQNIFTERGRKRLQPQKMIATGMGGATLGMLYTMFNLLMSGEDEDGELIYNKIPDWEKGRSMLFVMPDEISMGKDDKLEVKKFGEVKNYMKGDNPFAISIPLSYGYNFHFNLGRLFVETQAHVLFPDKFDKPVTSLEKAGYELADSFVTSFSPIAPIATSSTGIEGAISRTRAFAPSAIVRPLLDIAANENHFGAPITRRDAPFQPKTPGFTKATRSTRASKVPYVEFTEALNKMTGGTDYRSGWLDLDPNQMKYFIDYHIGGAGRTLERAGALPTKIKLGDIQYEDVPIIRSFTAQPQMYENGTLFYKRKEEIEAVLFEFKETKGKDRIALIKDKRRMRLKSLKGSLENAMDDIRKLNERERMFYKLYYERDPDKYSLETMKIDEKKAIIYQRFNKKYNRRVD